MRSACVLAVLVASMAFGRDGERRLQVHTARSLPAIESVTVYHQKDGKRAVAGEFTKLDVPLTLPAEGPVEVWVKPKGGIAVKSAADLNPATGKIHDLTLADILGVIEVIGDGLPRADKVVVTGVRDPGPGEKSHVAVQTASDYRAAMLVPAGTYAVWVVPANGARPQRVDDNVRVLAARATRVGG
jgi:hypothetical protein